MINEQLLKTTGAAVLSSKKKLQKTSGAGGSNHAPPPLSTCKWRLKQNAFVFLWTDEEICSIYAH